MNANTFGTLVFLSTLFTGTANAAPFCVKTAYATNCWYYDASSCRDAAQAANGMCLANSDEGDRSPSAYQPRAAGAPFYVKTAYAKNCWYYDVSSCRDAASTSNGMCVPND